MKMKLARRPKRIVPQTPRALQRKTTAHPAPPVKVPAGFITIREAARRLNRSQRTVMRWIDKGLLQVVLLGHNVLVRENTVDYWLKPRMYNPRRPAPPWLRQLHRRKQAQALVESLAKGGTEDSLPDSQAQTPAPVSAGDAA